MAQKLTRRGVTAGLAAAGLGAALPPAQGAVRKAAAKASPKRSFPYDTSGGGWRSYSGDQKGLRYSALDQIGAENFNRLELTWRYAEPGDNNLQATPLMVNGVIYTTAGIKRSAIALDAKSGQLLWRFDFDEGKRGSSAPRTGSGHGVSYWTDGREERILYVTCGYRLICLDARTGKVVAGFGSDGMVDLKLNDDQQINLDGEGVGQEIGLHSTPLVVGDVIVVGAAHSASASSAKHVKGYVRGFDVRSGARLWIFHTVPKKGEPGYETWLNGAAEFAGNTGNWAQNSADPDLGVVYLSIEQPTDDYYGGFRPGANLFGDCIVAMDVRTGKRLWYYQTVHHDVWDRDNMCAPILCDINVGGRKIRALAQATKQAFLFVLDRTNGKPVWPIPEMPVPQGSVPGEWYSPTQPMPARPPAFDIQGVPEEQLIDFTPQMRDEAIRLLRNYRHGHLYEPPSVRKWPDQLGTIQNPSTDGAGQWPGGALDPATSIYYIFSNLAYAVRGLVPGDPARTDLAMVNGIATAAGAQDAASPPEDGQPAQAPGGGRADARGAAGGRLTVQGLPLFKPPYGRITAIDLNKGEIVWQVAHGETPDDVKNNPALAGMTIPRTGSQGKVGVLVTKTLVIAGDGTATTGPDGKMGAWLRAYDKMTGREMGSVRMPTRATGSPMTYSVDGHQYIAVPVSGPGAAAQLAVYRLPA